MILLYHRQYYIDNTSYEKAKRFLEERYLLFNSVHASGDAIIEYFSKKYTELVISILFLHLLNNDFWTEKEFILNHIGEIQEMNNNIFEISKQKIKNMANNLQPLNSKELFKHLEAILDLADPSGQWKNIFSEAVNNNCFLIKSDLNPKEKQYYESFSKSSFNIIVGGSQKIILDNHQNLSDIPVAIHEFIHYLVNHFSKCSKTTSLLNEFPSCFYELLTLDYLQASHVDVKYLDQVLYYRYESFWLNSPLMNKVFMLFELMKQRDIITYSAINELNYNLNSKSFITQNDLLEIIDRMSYDEFFYVGLIPYIYGFYLSMQYQIMLKKDNNILCEMKYLTEHLYEIDPDVHYRQLINRPSYLGRNR